MDALRLPDDGLHIVVVPDDGLEIVHIACPDSRARSSFRAVKPLKPSRLEKRTTAAGDEAQAEAYSLAFIWMTSEVWSNR